MKFVLSGNLLRFANFSSEIEIDGATFGECVRVLVERHPSLAPVLLDGQGSLRSLVRVFLNGDQLVERDPARPVAPRDEVTLITPLAGG